MLVSVDSSKSSPEVLFKICLVKISLNDTRNLSEAHDIYTVYMHRRGLKWYAKDNVCSLEGEGLATGSWQAGTLVFCSYTLVWGKLLRSKCDHESVKLKDILQCAIV